MVEIFSKSLKYYSLNLARTPIEQSIKVLKKNSFDCKQTAVLVVCINNIGQYQWCFNRLLAMFLTLYFTT